ncbi:hypothetical protein [Streptomyces goshikiensis]|uniref:hypothetical protein n=1 Tax=Streptomyces goshikiensis TaxID=1942 RepID=UPI0036AA8B1C
MTTTAILLALLAYGFAGTAYLTAVQKGPKAALDRLFRKDRDAELAAETAPAAIALGVALVWLVALAAWPVIALLATARKLRKPKA